jgi:hypothetical protein
MNRPLLLGFTSGVAATLVLFTLGGDSVLDVVSISGESPTGQAVGGLAPAPMTSPPQAAPGPFNLDCTELEQPCEDCAGTCGGESVTACVDMMVNCLDAHGRVGRPD